MASRRPGETYHRFQERWTRNSIVIGGLGVLAMAAGIAGIVDSGSQQPLLSPIMAPGLEKGLGLTVFFGGSGGAITSAVLLFNKPL